LADLNHLDTTLSAPRYRHGFLLARGDLRLIDNHRISHDRTAYVDAPGQPRRKLRLWLNADGMAAEQG
jgi:hypothetical protein